MKTLDISNFETYVAGCASRGDVRVVWDKSTGTPRTDGNTIFIPRPDAGWSDSYMKTLRYSVKHETSHIVYTDFDYINKYQPQGLLAFVTNLLEDARIDYLNDKEYRGDRTISEEWALSLAKTITKNSTDAEYREGMAMVAPLFVWDAADVRDWIGNAHVISKAAAVCLDEVGEQRVAKLAKYTDEAKALRTVINPAEACFDLAKRIVKEVFDEDPNTMHDPSGSGGKKPGKKKPGEGEGEPGKATGDGDGEPVDGEGKGKSKDSLEDRIIAVEKLMAAMNHEHSLSRTGIHFEMPEITERGSWQIATNNDYQIGDFKRNKFASCLTVDKQDHRYFKKSDVNEAIDQVARPLANKLRIKLQTRAKDRYEYGTKKGKLHNGSLFRVLSGDDKQAERVFKRRVVSDTLDTAVELVVDCSGSMSGEKFETACQAAGAVSLALKPLHIPHTVIGFTNNVHGGGGAPIIWKFVSWGENIPQRELVDRFSCASHNLQDNSDGDAIAWAYRDIQQRTEKRKVIIVLSDGSPSGRSWAGDVAWYTRKVVSEIDADKHVEIYGIGIMDQNVKRFYKHNAVINNAKELPNALLTILDRVTA